MARKSRRAIEVNISTEEKVQEKATATAIYVRLSIENSGKNDAGVSIENQISLCREYVKERPYLSLYKVYEDNGEKGTHFDRPEFQKMMTDIRAGKIKCVVVKDLSRFGRDYIECGYYLEKIFPFMGVRFISITDNYDSFLADDAEGALMVPLKNMINAAYAKDISRKIITSFRARQEKGEFLPAFAPYGYVKSETVAYRYEPDPVTAPYVKKIFEWKVGGVSHSEISRRLTEMGAVTPAMRKVQLGIWKAEKYKTTNWYGRTIIDIMKNRTYTGCIVYGRMPKSLYEGIKMHRAEEDEWRIIPDAHEPLVSEKLFDTVQTMFTKRKQSFEKKLDAGAARREKYTNLFRGKIYCADCGKRMRYIKPTNPNKCNYDSYVCGGFLDSNRQRCTRHSIHAEDINVAALNLINTQISFAADTEAVIKKLRGTTGEISLKEKYQGAVNEASLKLSKVSEKQKTLYENFVDGILDESEYQFAKSRYEDDFTRQKKALEEAKQIRDCFSDALNLNNKWIEAVHNTGSSKELTQNVVNEFIKVVRIYDDRHVEFELNYEYDLKLLRLALTELEGK